MKLDQRDNGVFVLELRSHKSKKGDFENRFNAEIVKDMNGALDRVLTAGGKVLIVSGGDSKFFSNGHDIQWLEENFDTGSSHAFIKDFYMLLARLLCFPLPTIAAINGHAFAGGCLLALAMDYRVMRTDKGFICMNEIDMVAENPAPNASKITPGCFEGADQKMVRLLSQKLSPLLLRDMLLQGIRFDGRQAAENRIVDIASTDILESSLELALKLGKKSYKLNRRTIGVLKFEQHRDCINVLSGGNALALFNLTMSNL